MQRLSTSTRLRHRLIKYTVKIYENFLLSNEYIHFNIAHTNRLSRDRYIYLLKIQKLQQIIIETFIQLHVLKYIDCNQV